MRPIITLSDDIEVLETTGDLDAFEYGGGVVYRTPQREIYWQFWEPRDPGHKNFYVFTAPVPVDVLKYYDFAEDGILCKIGGTDKREIARLSRSHDPRERGRLVAIIKDAYGPSSVDPEETSEVLTPWDLAARWGDVYGRSIEEIPQANLDDFIIREHKMGNGYECGQVDGIYLGRFSDYKMALISIAKYMASQTGFAVNLFHEHEAGRLEMVDWEPKEYVDLKLSRRRKVLASVFWKNAMKKYVDDDKIKERIRNRQSSNKDVMKARQQSKARLNREKRIELARNLRRSMEEGIT